jgi:hypothetical protein
MVLGYNDRDNTKDGGWDWCAAVLPKDNMTKFLNDRRKAGKRDNFLFALASSGNLRGQGGVTHALYGFALAADMNRSAEELLHDYQLKEPSNLENGRFRFPNGVPILRLWRPKVPTPLADIMGTKISFDQNKGARGVRLGDPILTGLVTSAAALPLWEATLHRPQPVPDIILRELRKAGAEVAAPSRPLIEPMAPPGGTDVTHASVDESKWTSVSPLPSTDTESEGYSDPVELEGLAYEVVIEAAEREMLQRLAPEQRERAYRDHEAKRIGGLVEVRSGSGFCDILTDDEIVEVKVFACWRHALGQVLAYSYIHGERSCRIHLFDAPECRLEEVNLICSKFGVKVSYIC